ncbi:FecR domain-containing protein [bacterium]|nr:FecR domain-containing protein [bacterium]MBU1993650.1 FecR domain-containing protein [bacterium]
MKAFLVAVLISFFSLVYASGIVGTVEQLKGIVKVKSGDSIKKSNLRAGEEIKEGDLISTSKNASALIKLTDGSSVVLDESSSIHFLAANNAEQKDGKIYYKITSRDAQNSLKVKTPFAIIGIKGTTFIVNATENASVSLKEGLIGIQSIKEEFELYRKEVQKQFDNFISEQESEFEKYKDAQKKGVAQITKEFDLQAGNRVSFSGNQVDEQAWNKDDDAEFTRFEELINSMK